MIDEFLSDEEILMIEARETKKFIKFLITWFVNSLFIFMLIVIFYMYFPRVIVEVFGT